MIIVNNQKEKNIMHYQISRESEYDPLQFQNQFNHFRERVVYEEENSTQRPPNSNKKEAPVALKDRVMNTSRI